MALTIIFLVILVGGTLYFIWIYNRFVRLRNLVRSSWADIDVLLKKRYDLVGNLVETVKGYAAHEKSTLSGVTEARTRAIQAKGPAEKGKEETSLGHTLKSLFAVVEGYPELKANESFLELQNELTDIENEIGYARRYYNAVVRDNNTFTESFPSSIVASKFSFTREEYFQLESAEERESAHVRFS